MARQVEAARCGAAGIIDQIADAVILAAASLVGREDQFDILVVDPMEQDRVPVCLRQTARIVHGRRLSAVDGAGGIVAKLGPGSGVGPTDQKGTECEGQAGGKRARCHRHWFPFHS